MSMMDDMKNKGEELINNPDTKSKIEQIAKEKGLTFDQAKEQFMKQSGQSK